MLGFLKEILSKEWKVSKKYISNVQDLLAPNL